MNCSLSVSDLSLPVPYPSIVYLWGREDFSVEKFKEVNPNTELQLSKSDDTSFASTVRALLEKLLSLFTISHLLELFARKIQERYVLTRARAASAHVLFLEKQRICYHFAPLRHRA
jgi:hypothetical protein